VLGCSRDQEQRHLCQQAQVNASGCLSFATEDFFPKSLSRCSFAGAAAFFYDFFEPARNRFRKETPGRNLIVRRMCYFHCPIRRRIGPVAKRDCRGRNGSAGSRGSFQINENNGIVGVKDEKDSDMDCSAFDNGDSGHDIG
jgi:hypothetical protein